MEINTLKTPLVTIIVPCFNHEKYVKDCIKSILKQNYHKMELIIIDDGSTDKSTEKISEIIPECEERFIRVEFRARENKGVAATLNEGIDWANGEYISFIASDDLLHENKISLIIKKFKSLKTHYAAIFSDANFIDSNGNQIYLNKITGNITSRRDLLCTNSFIEFFASKRRLQYKNLNIFGSYPSLLEGNYIPAMGGVLKTKYIREVNGFSPKTSIEDWDLWLKLTKKYSFYFLPIIGAYYRLHGNNTFITNRKRLLQDSLILLERERLFAKVNGFEKQYYIRKASSILGLLKSNPAELFKYIKDFFNYKFIFGVLSIIKKKLIIILINKKTSF